MYTNPLQFEIQYECTQHLQHGALRRGGAARRRALCACAGP
jgi:hypothetical protein